LCRPGAIDCSISVLNHHLHLHACVTDGFFMPPADDAGSDAPPAFLPPRPQVHAAGGQWRRRALPVCRQDAGAAIQSGDRLTGRLQLQRLAIS
jgi:hypothetical protein